MIYKNNISKIETTNRPDRLVNVQPVEPLATAHHHHQAAAIMDAVAMLDQMHDAVITTDLHANISRCNKAAERLFGYPAKEIIGQPVYLLYPQEKQQFSAGHIIKILHANEDFEIEAIMRSRSGQDIFVRNSYSLLFDADAEVTGIISYTQDINEQKLAEQALRQNEDLMRRYYDAGLVGMSISSADKKHIQCNDTYCELMGYSREELQQMSWLALTHPDDIDKHIIQHDRILSGEIDGLIKDKRCIRKDGQIIYLTVSAKCVRKPDGTVDYFVTFVQDITERKRAERSLKESESHLREAQRIAHLGFWEWDIVKDKVSWPDETRSILGNPARENPAGLKALLRNITHLEDFKRVWQAITATLQDDSPYDIVHRLVRPDGQIRYVHAKAEVSRDAAGKAVRLAGTLQDITDSKRSEQALRSSEARLQIAQHVSKLGFVEWDMVKHKRYWSDQLYVITGQDPDSFDPSQTSLVDLIHPHDREHFSLAREASLLDKTPLDIETRIIRKDGEVRYIHARGEISYDDSGQPVRLIGTVMDITERRLAEAELTRYRKHLEVLVKERTSALEATQQKLIIKERLAVIGQLTATVSHELRNPLGTISSSLYSIAKKAAAQGLVLGSTMERAERNVVRCNNIIEELLDYTRIHKLELEQVAIDKWLVKILDEYQFPDGLTVSCELHAAATVEFEPERLHRCVINIINNACQAMNVNEDDTDIQSQKLIISSHIRDGRFEIQVDDTGPGISEDEMPNIFEPLYSTKIYGIGLGLSIVKHIMQLHNGGIEISSKQGEGTSVKLWLPLPQQKQEVRI